MYTRLRVAAVGGVLLVGASLAWATTVWNFDSPAGLTGWENDSSPPSAQSYELATFGGQSVLKVTAAAGQNDRVKVRTSEVFRAGTYAWHVYIPQIQEQGATNAVAAFIFSEQSGNDVNAR